MFRSKHLYASKQRVLPEFVFRIISCESIQKENISSSRVFLQRHFFTKCRPDQRSLVGSISLLKKITYMKCSEPIKKSNSLIERLQPLYWMQKRSYERDFHDEKEEGDEEAVDDFGEATDELLQDWEYNNCLRQYCSIPSTGHRLYIVQPVAKGPVALKYRTTSTGQLQLDEAIALVESLPRWSVVKTDIYNVGHINSELMFGKGQLVTLTESISKTPGITAVFIGVDKLRKTQLNRLQRKWHMPIFDRYTIVIQIFKEHAQTREAKLQVALAEVPHIRSRIGLIQQGNVDTQTSGAHFVGGTGETYIQARDHLLMKRERKLRLALDALKKQRTMIRESRMRRKLPTVAVIGYTNSGKTTLIKALTGDKDMDPRNQLFATLDVTAHAGNLPNNMLTLYMDTVGFISNIPNSLLSAFAATLEDAVFADLVVHVRDVSHPDRQAQKENVLQTVKRMLSKQQLTSMIEVCNKVDKLEIPMNLENDGNAYHISAVTGEGLPELQLEIQTKLLHNMGYMEKKLRIPMSGPHLSWLYKEATVVSTETDSNTESLIANVVIGREKYAKFMYKFGNPKKAIESR